MHPFARSEEEIAIGQRAGGGHMARPSKYQTHVQPKLVLVEAWARNGLTLDQIANNLGVALSSLCEYKNMYSELAEALKRGQEEIDTMVENALLKAALGYEYDEVSYNKDGDEAFRNRKYAAPNTTALIFWLKNRKSAEWRDKQQTELTGENGGALNVNFNIPRPKKNEA